MFRYLMRFNIVTFAFGIDIKITHLSEIRLMLQQMLMDWLLKNEPSRRIFYRFRRKTTAFAIHEAACMTCFSRITPSTVIVYSVHVNTKRSYTAIIITLTYFRLLLMTFRKIEKHSKNDRDLIKSWSRNHVKTPRSSPTYRSYAPTHAKFTAICARNAEDEHAYTYTTHRFE